MDDFKDVFLEEAPEMLESWEYHCLKLEKDLTNMEIINALFRTVHNLKGSSKSFNFDAFGDFVHIVENILTLAKDQNLQLTQEHISILLRAQSHLSTWLESIDDDPGCQSENPELESELKELASF